jgi:hypothetical protein
MSNFRNVLKSDMVLGERKETFGLQEAVQKAGKKIALGSESRSGSSAFHLIGASAGQEPTRKGPRREERVGKWSQEGLLDARETRSPSGLTEAA